MKFRAQYFDMLGYQSHSRRRRRYELDNGFHAYVQGGPKKLRPLRLTPHTFKTPEPICMTFDTIRGHFALNIYVNL